MESLLQENQTKRQELRNLATEMKYCTINIKEDLERDSQQLKKVAHAYEHSGNLLKRTNDAVDRMLAQSENRLAIYIGGTITIIGVLLWKFFLAS